MKRLTIIIAIVCMTIAQSPAGEKSALVWKTFDAGLAEAKKSDKKILIDVYTDWCRWCKVMDENTYTDAKVVDYLNKEFVVIKMNAESANRVTYKGKKATQMEISGAFGVDGYPATVFLEPNGDMITLLPGYVTTDRFLPIINYIGGSLYKKMTWEEYQKTLGKEKAE